jgi:hypothetical protein
MSKPSTMTRRGWDSETARHARVAANLTAHLKNIDPQPST